MVERMAVPISSYRQSESVIACHWPISPVCLSILPGFLYCTKLGLISLFCTVYFLSYCAFACNYRFGRSNVFRRLYLLIGDNRFQLPSLLCSVLLFTLSVFVFFQLLFFSLLQTSICLSTPSSTSFRFSTVSF